MGSPGKPQPCPAFPLLLSTTGAGWCSSERLKNLTSSDWTTVLMVMNFWKFEACFIFLIGLAYAAVLGNGLIPSKNSWGLNWCGVLSHMLVTRKVYTDQTLGMKNPVKINLFPSINTFRLCSTAWTDRLWHTKESINICYASWCSLMQHKLSYSQMEKIIKLVIFNGNSKLVCKEPRMWTLFFFFC